MRKTTSVGSKRKLENTEFAEVSSGPTSHLAHQEESEINHMKATLLAAGFKLNKGNISKKDLFNLYKRHVFETSKARKQSSESTPYDERDRASIHSTRYSRTVYIKPDDAEDAESRDEEGLTLSAASHLFTFKLPPNSNEDHQNHPVSQTPAPSSEIPALAETEQQNPSSGPLRKRRTSRRLSALSCDSELPEDNQTQENTSTRRLRPRQTRLKSSTAGSVSTILEEEALPVAPEKIKSSKSIRSRKRAMIISQIRRRQHWIRFPQKLDVTPPRSLPALKPRKMIIPRSLNSASTNHNSDDEPESPPYYPTVEDDSNDEMIQPQILLHDSSSRKLSKKSRTRTNTKFQLSSPESNISLTEHAEKNCATTTLNQESSEDTSDLHESSNFRISPINTRATTSFNQLPESDEEDDSQPFPFSSLKWKGKGRAKNQDGPNEDDEVEAENRSKIQSAHSSLNQETENRNEEERDAGDLFGEGVNSVHTNGHLGLDGEEPRAKEQDSNGHFDQNEMDDIRDLRKALILLSSLTTDNSNEIKSWNHKFDEKFSVLTNLVQSAINQSETRRPNRRTPATSSTNNSEVFGDSTPNESPSGPPRAARTLYGLKKDDKVVPNGATPAEKREWMATISMQELLDKARDLPEAEQIRFPPTGDPYFPYPNGPGGDKASPRALHIMWDVMQSVGVRSFRPDYSESLGCPGNIFLFKIATVIFIKLVQSGEYSGVSPDDIDAEKVLKLMISHIKGTWFRNYREQRQWSRQRLEARHKRRNQQSRVNSVREGRLSYIMSHKALWALAPVVQSCCSDDETDYEDEEGRKHCKVRIIQWRSSQLDTIFQAIDEARVKSNHVKLSPGVQPRIRTRSHNNPISDLLPPDEIHKDCISQVYYDQLDTVEKAEIKIINKSILRDIKEMIVKKLLPLK
ncbi:uncharacterized protein MELLADRAFT_94086 [Melampsora larici-populina 98AG31]|uniref:Uncharacterized protein n=1 Tax=Melampsora larici-populina (strain 98AG31 / pathotype 3-4-7) TaxID=747676 RepID=F4S6C4_MELLP|nr:uncharacterized protein MELLADRAFT_94086 [Melampsora larici-populina 98AG31]EGF99821.1 hypothetical protein MELLADRAFT_94086 [Melampsora larici-populina 98AG31]